MNFAFDMLLHAHNQQYNDKFVNLPNMVHWEIAKGSLSSSRIFNSMASMRRVFQTHNIYLGCFTTNSTIIIYTTKVFKYRNIKCNMHALVHKLINKRHILIGCLQYILLCIHVPFKFTFYLLNFIFIRIVVILKES